MLAEGKRVLINDPTRFDGVKVVGLDEHVWWHTRRGDKHVTLVIDLTPVRDRTGPARLLDMVEGRSKQAFTTWLADRPQAWRDAVEVVAMDGLTGFETATTGGLSDAVALMDPFHVVWLGGDAEGPPEEAVRRRRPRRSRGNLGHRPADERRLPRARQAHRTPTDAATSTRSATASHDR